MGTSNTEVLREVGIPEGHLRLLQIPAWAAHGTVYTPHLRHAATEADVVADPELSEDEEEAEGGTAGSSPRFFPALTVEVYTSSSLSLRRRS